MLPRLRLARALRQWVQGFCLLACAALAQAQGDPGAGPIRLRQPVQVTPPTPVATAVAAGESAAGEFERYVQRLAETALMQEQGALQDAGRSDASRSGTPPRPPEVPRIRRFGSDLMARADDLVDTHPLVPADYLVKPGDEIVVTLWGSVDADLRAVVDRSGRIVIPRVGPVFVSGVRYEDLPGTISRRVGQVFKNFELAVSLGQLRAVRVYVTGYVPRPGAYSVSSLSTLATALMRAGGPLASGSFRNIQLRRGDQVVSQFDLYELLLKGNRSADRTVQPDDVVLVGPVGPQVALIGSVNQPAIYELKPGETVADVMRMAGGFSALADRSRLSMERLDDRATIRVRELALPVDSTLALAHGDILRAFSAVDALLPAQRQNKRVRIEGEVQRPGDYVLPPESSIRDALRAAGGMTNAAYVYGTEFSRETVRVKQQENYDRALRDLETELTRATNTQRTATAEEAGSVVARSNATARLIDRLRSIRPNGRVVLQLPPQTTELPDLALEDGDRIYIPSRYTTVGVFGSVFNSGSYLFGDGRMLSDYLRLAGGPTRGADADSVFVIRANGAVISGRQQSGWFSGDEFARVPALPGDTLFVPEEVNKTTFLQLAKDWTQILYQLGLGVAGLRAFSN